MSTRVHPCASLEAARAGELLLSSLHIPGWLAAAGAGSEGTDDASSPR